MKFHLVALAIACFASAEVHAIERPNIVFILADDLGFGDLGSYGQTKIKTPHLDTMAEEGMRFSQFYAGSTVCAPSRCVLMTGQHTGRCWVRGNSDGDSQTLRPEDVTIAEVLKTVGYKTALSGKWGLGEEGTVGHPNKQGFDHFFGYLNQRHAHNYYPSFLVRNDERVALRNIPEEEGEDGAGWAKKRIDYSHDLIMEDALDWLGKTGEEPFFLYLSLTIPHANNEGTGGTGNGQEVPDYGIYSENDWPDPDKGQAAMISRMDRDIGTLFSKLKEMAIDEKTLVIFTSDNGHHAEGGNDPKFFDANGPLRGMKRDLFEGGIRVPMIARWPGKIAEGSISRHAGYAGDFMATFGELGGAEVPENIQSVSLVPTFEGSAEDQKEHRYLYWEFFETGGKQAVVFDEWKAIRMPPMVGEVSLFNLGSDLGEANDVSSKHPEIVAMAIGFMDDAHVDNKNWKPRGKPYSNPEPGAGKLPF